eukprot:scaffold4.g4836.t1
MAGPAGPSGAPSTSDALADLMPGEEDLLYEEELLRNPYSLKMWLRYLDARKSASPRKRYLLFERAVKALPGSYKLWLAYLTERLEGVKGLSQAHPAVEAMNNVFERAMVSMHKMPRIWLLYLEFMLGQAWVTRMRRLLDRCLTSLPITQHERVWPIYMRFITQPGIPEETAVRVYRRYLKLEPTHAEEYIAYLKIHDRWEEAARRLATVVNEESFRSLEGKSKHQLWLELCDMVTKHPNEVKGMRVDAILRSGIRRFTDEARGAFLPCFPPRFPPSLCCVGRLWTSLADYYIRRGMFERARDESLGTPESTKVVYEAMLDLKVATPQIVLNYAAFLQEHKYFEDSFRVYERGVALFKYPHVKDIWAAYLTQFVQRYGGKKVERARDLFRQATEEAPPEEARPLFLQRAAYEEAHGLARNAMQARRAAGAGVCIYEAAVRKVPDGERLSVYEVYIARASDFFGVGKRLGEIDRARAIYVHGASLANPRTVHDFWDEWNAFEVKHGNEETFREMLRIKRSIAASFSQLHFNTTVIDAAAVAASADAGALKRKRAEAAAAAGAAPDAMAGLEATAAGGGAAAAGAEGGGAPAFVPGTRVAGFVSAGVIQQGTEGAGGAGAGAAAPAEANPEELELAEPEEDEEGGGAGAGEGAADGVELEARPVPEEVFGSLKRQRTDAGPA